MPESCPWCGASTSSHKRFPWEVAITVFCGCLLLSILIPIGLMAEHRVEDAGRRFIDRMVWREPVDRW